MLIEMIPRCTRCRKPLPPTDYRIKQRADEEDGVVRLRWICWVCETEEEFLAWWLRGRKGEEGEHAGGEAPEPK